MHKLELTSRTAKRAKTRAFIEVGKIVEETGILEVFGIDLGEELQKSPQMKEPVEALFKNLLALKENAQSEDWS